MQRDKGKHDHTRETGLTAVTRRILRALVDALRPPASCTQTHQDPARHAHAGQPSAGPHPAATHQPPSCRAPARATRSAAWPAPRPPPTLRGHAIAIQIQRQRPMPARPPPKLAPRGHAHAMRTALPARAARAHARPATAPFRPACGPFHFGWCVVLLKRHSSIVRRPGRTCKHVRCSRLPPHYFRGSIGPIAIAHALYLGPYLLTFSFSLSKV